MLLPGGGDETFWADFKRCVLQRKLTKTSVNKRQKKLNDLLKIDEQENRRERCF